MMKVYQNTCLAWSRTSKNGTGFSPRCRKNRWNNCHCCNYCHQPCI